jgi:hypothetical protein
MKTARTPPRAGNATALTDARARSAARKHRTVMAALARAEECGDPLTVSSLAADASLSRQFIYSKPQIVERLRRHQERNPEGGGEPLRAARRADLVHANETIKQLKQEIRQLDRQLDAGLAAQVELRDETRLRQLFEQRGHELTRITGQNADLTRTVTELRETVRSLEDDLAVERAAVRALADRRDNVVDLHPSA